MSFILFHLLSGEGGREGRKGGRVCDETGKHPNRASLMLCKWRVRRTRGEGASW